MGERLTWEEIKAKYPHRQVGLVDCLPDEDNWHTAVVKYTDKDMSYDELAQRAFAGEIILYYTTMDEDVLIAL